MTSTIAEHLARDTAVAKVPAVSTIWRILSRRGFVVPQPHKRPRSAWRRFQAELPNQCWQADVTHWRLADHTEVEILDHIDDHSRLAIASHARPVTTGPDVVDTFVAAFAHWGTPAGVLTDNGAIFTAKQRGDGRTALEITLGELGIKYSRSRPYHPQTCGKVERFHQTLKKHLRALPAGATVPQLQHQIDAFLAYYNTIRPHRALQRRTPIQAFNDRPKAFPTGYQIPPHYRVRHDSIDAAGVITIRHNSRLHHIGLSKRLRGTKVTVPLADTPRWDATTAIEGLYRPRWSTEILAELEYHETQKLINRGERPDTAAARATRQISEMTTAFDDALVESWEPRDGAFNLPDPDDEHVVATALVGGADAIVTDNLKDFPIRDELSSQLAFDREGGSVHKFVGHGGQEKKS